MGTIVQFLLSEVSPGVLQDQAGIAAGLQQELARQQQQVQQAEQANSQLQQSLRQVLPVKPM